MLIESKGGWPLSHVLEETKDTSKHENISSSLYRKISSYPLTPHHTTPPTHTHTLTHIKNRL